MTVLVTGGCGYIGAHVVHALHQAGEKVVVVDDLSYGKPTRIEGSRLYGMDIAAPGAGERLAEILDAEGVDSVIHFAARKQVGESVEKPLWYYQQNINGMLNVLTGMTQSKNAKKLVFSSSAATYGVPPVDVVPEDVVPMLPINPYGQTKLFGEWMARACEQPFGIRFCALRYFNVAGCGPVELEDPAILNLIPMLFDRLKKGKAPAIFGDDYPTPDGTCVRDYIHVSDLADAHIAALKYLDRDERKYDAFNVGTGEGTSVRQIVDEVKKVTGLPFEETVMARRAGDPPPCRRGSFAHRPAGRHRRCCDLQPQDARRGGRHRPRPGRGRPRRLCRTGPCDAPRLDPLLPQQCRDRARGRDRDPVLARPPDGAAGHERGGCPWRPWRGRRAGAADRPGRLDHRL